MSRAVALIIPCFIIMGGKYWLTVCQEEVRKTFCLQYLIPSEAMIDRLTITKDHYDLVEVKVT